MAKIKISLYICYFILCYLYLYREEYYRRGVCVKRCASLDLYALGYSPENRGGEVIFMDSGARQRMDYWWRILRRRCTTPWDFARIGGGSVQGNATQQREGEPDVIKATSDWPSSRRDRASCSCRFSQRN